MCICFKVRQKTTHKKTFYYLEQVILKHQMHQNTTKISSKPSKHFAPYWALQRLCSPGLWWTKNVGKFYGFFLMPLLFARFCFFRNFERSFERRLVWCFFLPRGSNQQRGGWSFAKPKWRCIYSIKFRDKGIENETFSLRDSRLSFTKTDFLDRDRLSPKVLTLCKNYFISCGSKRVWWNRTLKTVVQQFYQKWKTRFQF